VHRDDHRDSVSTTGVPPRHAALNDVYESGDFRAHLPIAEECGPRTRRSKI
jgi:hypothetical protein